MKERPILFNGAMVRAILDGRKTQTRRLFKVRQNKKGDYLLRCPYGEIGDRLWVRETHCRCVKVSTGEVITYYRADNEDHFDSLAGTWTPSIFMKRADSRILLEITDICVQRLQEITEEDAIAEGCHEGCGLTAIEEYRMLWESINGAGSWDANPLVYKITFKRVEAI